MVEDMGWGSDHIGKLLKLQKVVMILAKASGKTTQRLNKATYILTGLFPRDFPEHVRQRAQNVLSLREKYVFHAGGDSYFQQVPTGEYRKFVEDVLAIYDACLIDAGRLDEGLRSIVYPKDRKKKRPEKKKG